jgi:hypothetical protein
MKRGDLVLIKNTKFEPWESHFGIFWEDSVDFEEWGYLPLVNCTLLWENQFIPFVKSDLELVGEYNETWQI